MAAPTVAFLVANAVTGALVPAVAAAGVVAAAAFGWRLHRREPPHKAVPGVLIVAICAAVAAVTGQARGFFLVPTAARVGAPDLTYGAGPHFCTRR